MSLLGRLITDPLYQREEPRRPEEIAEPAIIISPDTRREKRLPPGQSRTRKWPVLDAHGTPKIDLDKWQFAVDGLVENQKSWTLDEFKNLPQIKVYADFHCVTRWSRLDNGLDGRFRQNDCRNVRRSAGSQIRVGNRARYGLARQ